MKNLLNRVGWIGAQGRPFISYIVIVLVFSVISSVIGIYRAIISKELIDSATVDNSNMRGVIIIFASVIMVDLILKVIVSLVSSKGNIKISNYIQKHMYERIMKIKWQSLSKLHSGDILTRMTSDIEIITNSLINVIPSVIAFFVLLAGSVITLFFMEPSLAITLLVISPFTIIISRFFSVRLKDIFLQSQKVESKYRSFLNESFQNMLVVKTFTLENHKINQINELQEKKADLVMKKTKLSIISNYVLSLGYWTGYFIVFAWSAYKLSIGQTTFGNITAMVQLIANIQGPFSAIAALLPSLVAAVASAERIMEIEKLDLDVNLSEQGIIESANITCEKIDFNYEENKAIFKNLSFKINSGDKVAVMGPSGEGKTTLFKLFLALITPDKGNIFIENNIDKIKVSAGTRKYISYVPQGNTLFSGTIKENLLIGNPKATMEELKIAVDLACAGEFINKMADKFDTVLGERGFGLSEGQAQRLCIARALLNKKPILLLDEATSALDADTEIKILENLKKLKPSPTCLIITHRKAAINICDRLIKIKNGYLKEELLKKRLFSTNIN